MLEACEDRTTPTPVVTIATLTADAYEGGSTATFRLTRTGDTGSPLGVSLSLGGTASSSDHDVSNFVGFQEGHATVDVTVTADDDGESEPTETLIATIVLGMDDYTIGSPSSATVYIHDNDPLVAVAATDTFEGAATGGFTFTRSGGNLAASLVVNFSLTGSTATSGTDYTAIGTSVTFAANQDRVELPVEALGDNTNDDGETVVLTISSSSNYLIDMGADDATVTIADQPLTISVVAMEDGDEFLGGAATNGKFRIIRSGDLSQQLTVTYTVGGTATSGSDFTALSGSVTFNQNDEFKVVTVYVYDDGVSEQTETVTLTLDEDEGYLLGNDSDTIFIRDDDTRRLVWTGGGGDGEWTNQYNWYIWGTTTNAAPTQYDDVYFNAANTGNCINVGAGLSSTGLYGLHIVGTYNGTLTLANALSVGSFEQTAGTLNQPSSTRDLTITAVMLWSGGTLGGTDDGAEVTADGASARIDPPDTGSMSMGSTFRLVNSAVVTALPGTMKFIGGDGMVINAKMKYRTENNTEVKVEKDTGGDQLFDIASAGKLEIVKPDQTRTGHFVSDVPIKNAGVLISDRGIHLVVNGRVGANGPSISQIGGQLHWWTGTNIVSEHGMSVSGGNMYISACVEKSTAILVGNFTLSAGTLNMVGGAGLFANFEIQGNVSWTGGTYKPRFGFSGFGANDSWAATGGFVVDQGVVFEPGQLEPEAGQVKSWLVLFGSKGIGLVGDLPAVTGLPTYYLEHYPQTGLVTSWFLSRP